jgi:hypothetical protein
MEFDSCVSGRLSVCICFKVWAFTVSFHIKEVYVPIVFLCRIDFYAAACLVYVCVEELGLCLGVI